MEENKKIYYIGQSSWIITLFKTVNIDLIQSNYNYDLIVNEFHLSSKASYYKIKKSGILKKKPILFLCGENLLSKNNFTNSVFMSIFDRSIKVLEILLKIKLTNVRNFIDAYLYFLHKKNFPLLIHTPRKYQIYKYLLKQQNSFFIGCNKGYNAFKYPIAFIAPFRKNTIILNAIDNLKHQLEKRENFCAFIVSNPRNPDRVKFFLKLSKYKKVDSYGKLIKNADFPEEILDNNIELYKRYKFVICFENSYTDNYITEKILRVMVGGAIPIYHGAPNIGEYFNVNSFINYNDYGSYEKMIEKVIELDQDDEKYQKFIQQKFLKERICENINKELKDFGNAIHDTIQILKKGNRLF